MKIFSLNCASLSILNSIDNSGDIPPLIDRKLFFEDPDISGAQLSPDGKFISFLRPFEGTRNIWIKSLDQSFDQAVPLTQQKARPVSNYFWSRDGKFILFSLDKDGDENFNIYAVNPHTPDIESGELRNLTQMEGARAIIYHLCREDKDLLYIGLNKRDPAWHDLYQLRISTAELSLVRENTHRYLNWIFDHEDRMRLAVRNREDGTGELYKLDSDGVEKKLIEWSILESVHPMVFHKDNQRIYLLSNKGDENDLSALYLLDIDSGDTEFVEKDPLSEVDFGGLFFSEKEKSVIATSYTGNRTRYYFRDREFEREYKQVKNQLKGHEIGFRSPTLDEDKWLVSAHGDVEPGSTYLYDRKSESLEFQYKVRPEIPRTALAEMHSISYPSSDGLIIPAYLTLPVGKGKENLPLVVMPHGGPWVRDYWGYNNFAQFLANRGYAVLNPNFRISSGYGKSFLNAGNRQWGDKMQDDLSWGVKYLVDSGVADKKRVGIFGGSYGGYATLAGLAFTPEIYACGVSFVGPSNLITLLESIPPYWESGRKMFHIRMGDPTTEEGRDQLIRQSPLFSADKIKAPLMVVQGQNDPRVKKAESDQIVVALRKRGFPVEYLNAPDEGHGFARPINNMAFIAAMEKFLAHHLGGRHQREMSDDVERRLEEITVNTDEL